MIVLKEVGNPSATPGFKHFRSIETLPHTGAAWLAGGLAGLVGGLAGLAGWLVGWLAGWLVGWLAGMV